ncbi:hypothetical protein P8452_75192 [Trifolium repens]|nr:hypothetical protein P8452_75192 [Trifolium repens]
MVTCRLLCCDCERKKKQADDEDLRRSYAREKKIQRWCFEIFGVLQFFFKVFCVFVTNFAAKLQCSLLLQASISLLCVTLRIWLCLVDLCCNLVLELLLVFDAFVNSIR